MPVSLEDVESLSSRYSRRGDGLQAIPIYLADFIVELISSPRPSSVLVPYTTSGILPLRLSKRMNPKRLDAISPRSETAEVLSWLGGHKVALRVGESLDLIDQLDSYQAVAACLPLGVRAAAREIELNGSNFEIFDLAEQLIAKSCLHLDDDGLGVFVVSSSMFTRGDRAGGFYQAIQHLGWHLDAAIELPRSTIPSAHISTHLIVIKRERSETIFTGRLPDDSDGIQQLLTNYRKRKSSPLLQLGHLAPQRNFRGFSPIEHTISAARLAEQAGLAEVPFDTIFEGVHLADREPNLMPLFSNEDFEFIFLPRIGTRPALTMRDELPERLHNYFQLLVNTEVANPEYLVNWFNEPHGMTWRESVKSGGAMGAIHRRDLQASVLYLPSKSIQDAVVACHNRLENEQARLNELRNELWKKPKQVAEFNERLTSPERGKGIEQWIDSLPFPLASILWICHAESGTAEEQFRRKLHFFEAFSQFLAVIHMSAFSSDHGLWKEVSVEVNAKLAELHLNLDRATFGTWNVINQRLMKRLRTMLNDEESRELCFELYRTTDGRFLAALCDKNLLTIAQKANAYRNRTAHGGAMSESDSDEINDALQQLILDVRNVFGFLWEDYQLLLPGPNEYDSGVFKTQVQVLQGTRQPFPWSIVDVLGPMQKGSLHFKSIDGQQTLELLPLVKVVEPPAKEQNACYFYNRKESDGISFHSYHFRAESNLTEQFPDTEKAITRLFLGQ